MESEQQTNLDAGVRRHDEFSFAGRREISTGRETLKPSTALFNQPRPLGDLLDGAMFFADFCNELFRGLVVGDHSQVC